MPAAEPSFSQEATPQPTENSKKRKRAPPSTPVTAAAASPGPGDGTETPPVEQLTATGGVSRFDSSKPIPVASARPVFVPTGDLFLTDGLAMNKQRYRYTDAVEVDAFVFHSQPSSPADCVRVCWEDRSPYIRVSQDGLTLAGDRGFRSARFNVAVREGSWYMEFKIDRGGGDNTDHDATSGDGAHVRVGWARREAPLNAPVGLDGYSYGFRDKTGDKVTLSRPKPYGKPFGTGDVVGLYISLPPAREPDPEDPHDPAQIVRKRQAVGIRGRVYHESVEYGPCKEMLDLLERPPDLSTTPVPTVKRGPQARPAGVDNDEAEHSAPRPSKSSATVKNPPGSRSRSNKATEKVQRDRSLVTLGSSARIAFFINGECQGTAFQDIYDYLPLRLTNAQRTARSKEKKGSLRERENPFDDGTLGYYPFVSLYKAGRVTINAGPHFAFPPPPDIDAVLDASPQLASVPATPDTSKRTWRPLSERYSEFWEEIRRHDLADDGQQRAFARAIQESKEKTQAEDEKKNTVKDRRRQMDQARRRAKGKSAAPSGRETPSIQSEDVQMTEASLPVEDDMDVAAPEAPEAAEILTSRSAPAAFEVIVAISEPEVVPAAFSTPSVAASIPEPAPISPHVHRPPYPTSSPHLPRQGTLSPAAGHSSILLPTDVSYHPETSPITAPQNHPAEIVRNARVSPVHSPSAGRSVPPPSAHLVQLSPVGVRPAEVISPPASRFSTSPVQQTFRFVPPQAGSRPDSTISSHHTMPTSTADLRVTHSSGREPGPPVDMHHSLGSESDSRALEDVSPTSQRATDVHAFGQPVFARDYAAPPGTSNQSLHSPVLDLSQPSPISGIPRQSPAVEHPPSTSRSTSSAYDPVRSVIVPFDPVRSAAAAAPPTPLQPEPPRSAGRAFDPVRSAVAATRASFDPVRSAASETSAQRNVNSPRSAQHLLASTSTPPVKVNSLMIDTGPTGFHPQWADQGRPGSGARSVSSRDTRSSWPDTREPPTSQWERIPPSRGEASMATREERPLFETRPSSSREHRLSWPEQGQPTLPQQMSRSPPRVSNLAHLLSPSQGPPPMPNSAHSSFPQPAPLQIRPSHASGYQQPSPARSAHLTLSPEGFRIGTQSGQQRQNLFGIAPSGSTSGNTTPMSHSQAYPTGHSPSLRESALSPFAVLHEPSRSSRRPRSGSTTPLGYTQPSPQMQAASVRGAVIDPLAAFRRSPSRGPSGASPGAFGFAHGTSQSQPITVRGSTSDYFTGLRGSQSPSHSFPMNNAFPHSRSGGSGSVPLASPSMSYTQSSLRSTSPVTLTTTLRGSVGPGSPIAYTESSVRSGARDDDDMAQEPLDDRMMDGTYRERAAWELYPAHRGERIERDEDGDVHMRRTRM
ncbi:hypothetical protein BKA62DRAFT_133737 [Auriculariales sp. MPI-PUGE-AT-0066]|nr:hypothetical protein BKA62DRAFT_133737 [Auriculariales sp. MPI-PUGE-AT-0066]